MQPLLFIFLYLHPPMVPQLMCMVLIPPTKVPLPQADPHLVFLATHWMFLILPHMLLHVLPPLLSECPHRLLSPHPYPHHLLLPNPAHDSTHDTCSKNNIFKPKQIHHTTTHLLPSPIKPTCVSQAFRDHNWCTTIFDEINAFLCNGTWELVPAEPNQNIVGYKWVFQIKCNPDGTLAGYKASLVAKPFALFYQLPLAMDGLFVLPRKSS